MTQRDMHACMIDGDRAADSGFRHGVRSRHPHTSDQTHTVGRSSYVKCGKREGRRRGRGSALSTASLRQARPKPSAARPAHSYAMHAQGIVGAGRNEADGPGAGLSWQRVRAVRVQPPQAATFEAGEADTLPPHPLGVRRKILLIIPVQVPHG